MVQRVELASPWTKAGLVRLSCTQMILELWEASGNICHPQQQLVYYVTSGYGELTIEGGGGGWGYVIEQDMAVWLAADITHRFHNLGEGPLRFIQFACQVDPEESPRGYGKRIVRVCDIPVEEETARLLRLIFRGTDIGSTRIVTVEKATYYPGGSSPMHAAEGMEEIFYFLTGSGQATVGDERVDVRAGMALAIPSGVTHNVESTNGQVLKHITCNIRT